jgi:hypothetical protein
MYRDRARIGGKVRAPANSEEAAIFRADCQRLGIDHTNCHYRLGIGKSMFYYYGNGDMPIPVPVSKLLDSIEAYQKLKTMFDALEAELMAVREIRE